MKDRSESKGQHGEALECVAKEERWNIQMEKEKRGRAGRLRVVEESQYWLVTLEIEESDQRKGTAKKEEEVGEWQ